MFKRAKEWFVNAINIPRKIKKTGTKEEARVLKVESWNGPVSYGQVVKGRFGGYIICIDAHCYNGEVEYVIVYGSGERVFADYGFWVDVYKKINLLRKECGFLSYNHLDYLK